MRQSDSLSTAVSILRISNTRQTGRRKALGSVHPNFNFFFFLLLILILVVPSHADSFSIMHTAFVISSETSANQPIKSIEFQK